MRYTAWTLEGRLWRTVIGRDGRRWFTIIGESDDRITEILEDLNRLPALTIPDRDVCAYCGHPGTRSAIFWINGVRLHPHCAEPNFYPDDDGEHQFFDPPKRRRV